MNPVSSWQNARIRHVVILLALVVLTATSALDVETREGKTVVPGSFVADTIIRLPEYAELRYEIPRHFRQSVEILFWTPAYGELSHWGWWFSRDNIKGTCPEVAERCTFTTDKGRLNESDAVAFMTYGSSMRLKEDMTDQLPPHRSQHQRWVHVSLEPQCLNKDEENLTQLDGLFNWTLDYRRDADVFAPYVRIVLKKLPLAQREAALRRDYAVGKTKPAAWYVSHCNTEGHREKFVEELQRYLPVDIYGGCGPLKCEPPRSHECYDKLAQYHFYLSFENILCDDYVSEKFLNALGSDVVPVVFGGANYAAFAPPGSYIDALAYDSPKDLADYLLRLTNDTVQYNRYFDWQRGYSVSLLKDAAYVCELCLKLMDPDQPEKSYASIDDWWNRGGNCRTWNPEKH